MQLPSCKYNKHHSKADYKSVVQAFLYNLKDIHQFMGTIHRDMEKHGVDTLFIFTHGTTLRTFLLRWFHYSPEWYHEERNPKNCWIREIEDGQDLGYINQ